MNSNSIGIVFVGVEDDWYNVEGNDMAKACVQWVEAAHLDRAFQRAAAKMSSGNSNNNNAAVSASAAAAVSGVRADLAAMVQRVQQAAAAGAGGQQGGGRGGAGSRVAAAAAAAAAGSMAGSSASVLGAALSNEPLPPLFATEGTAFFYPMLSPEPPFVPAAHLAKRARDRQLILEQAAAMAADNNASKANTTNNATTPRGTRSMSNAGNTASAAAAAAAAGKKAATDASSASAAAAAAMAAAAAAAAEEQDREPPATVEQLVDAYMRELEAFCHSAAEHGQLQLQQLQTASEKDIVVKIVVAPLLHPALIRALRERELAGYADLYLAHVLVAHVEVPQDLYTAPQPGYPPGKEAVLLSPFGIGGQGAGGRSGGGGGGAAAAVAGGLAALIQSPAAMALAKNAGRTPRSGRSGAGGGGGGGGGNSNAKKDKGAAAFDPVSLLPPDSQVVMSTAVEQTLASLALIGGNERQPCRLPLPSTSYVEHKRTTASAADISATLLATMAQALTEIDEALEHQWGKLTAPQHRPIVGEQNERQLQLQRQGYPSADEDGERGGGGGGGDEEIGRALLNDNNQDGDYLLQAAQDGSDDLDLISPCVQQTRRLTLKREGQDNQQQRVQNNASVAIPVEFNAAVDAEEGAGIAAAGVGSTALRESKLSAAATAATVTSDVRPDECLNALLAHVAGNLIHARSIYDSAVVVRQAVRKTKLISAATMAGAQLLQQQQQLQQAAALGRSVGGVTTLGEATMMTGGTFTATNASTSASSALSAAAAAAVAGLGRRATATPMSDSAVLGASTIGADERSVADDNGGGTAEDGSLSNNNNNNNIHNNQNGMPQRIPFVYHEVATDSLLLEARPGVKELSKAAVTSILAQVAPWATLALSKTTTTATANNAATATATTSAGPMTTLFFPPAEITSMGLPALAAAAAAAAAARAAPTADAAARKRLLSLNSDATRLSTATTAAARDINLGDALFVSRWCESAAEEQARQQAVDETTTVPHPALAFDLLSKVSPSEGSHNNNSNNNNKVTSITLTQKHVQSVSRWVTPIERSHVLSQALLDAEALRISAATGGASCGSGSDTSVSGSHPFTVRLSCAEAWAAAMDAEASSLFPASARLSVIELQDGPQIRSLFAPQAVESTVSSRLASAATENRANSGEEDVPEKKRALYLLHNSSNCNLYAETGASKAAVSAATTKPQQLPTPIALLVVHQRPPAHRAFATSLVGSGSAGGGGVLQLRCCAELADSDDTPPGVADFARWLLRKFNAGWGVASAVPASLAARLVEADAQRKTRRSIISVSRKSAPGGGDQQQQKLLLLEQQQQHRDSTFSQLNSSPGGRRPETPTRGRAGGAAGAKTAAAAATGKSSLGGTISGGGAAAAAMAFALEEALVAARAAAPRLSTAQRFAATASVLRDLSLVAEEQLELHPSDGSVMGVSVTAPAIGSHRAVWEKDDVSVSLCAEDSNGTTQTRVFASFTDGGLLSLEGKRRSVQQQQQQQQQLDEAARQSAADIVDMYDLFFQRDGCILKWGCSVSSSGTEDLTPSSFFDLYLAQPNVLPLSFVDPTASSSSVGLKTSVDSFIETRRRVDASTATVLLEAVRCNNDRSKSRPTYSSNERPSSAKKNRTLVCDTLPQHQQQQQQKAPTARVSLHPDGKMVVVYIDEANGAKTCLVTLANGRRYCSAVVLDSSPFSVASSLSAKAAAAAASNNNNNNNNGKPNADASNSNNNLNSNIYSSVRRNSRSSMLDSSCMTAASTPPTAHRPSATTPPPPPIVVSCASAADDEPGELTRLSLDEVPFSSFSPLPAVGTTAQFDMQHSSNITCNAALSSIVNVVGSADTVASFGIGVNIATAHLSSSSRKHQISFDEQSCPGVVISSSSSLPRPVVSVTFHDGTVVCSGQRNSSSNNNNSNDVSITTELSQRKCFSLYRPSGSSVVVDATSGLVFVTPSSLRIDAPSLHHAALAANTLVVDIETRTMQLVEQYAPFVTRVTLPGGRHCFGDTDYDEDAAALAAADGDASSVSWRPNRLLYPQLAEFDGCLAVRRSVDAEEELIRMSGQGCVVPPSGKIVNGGDRERIRGEVERANCIVRASLYDLVVAVIVGTARSVSPGRQRAAGAGATLQEKMLRITVPFISSHRLIEYETVRQRVARTRGAAAIAGTSSSSSLSVSRQLAATGRQLQQQQQQQHAMLDAATFRACFPHISNATMPRVIDDFCSLLSAPQPALQLYVIFNDGHAQRHLTAREALQQLLQRSCTVPLPQVSASRVAVAGEDAVEKWVFSFRSTVSVAAASAAAAAKSGAQQQQQDTANKKKSSGSNNSRHARLVAASAPAAAADINSTGFAPTTQLWSGVPPPLATSPQLLLPQDFRPSTFAANQVSSQQAQMQKRQQQQKQTTGDENNISNGHDDDNNGRGGGGAAGGAGQVTVWGLTRYQPIAAEARAAIIDDAVRSQRARERAASFRMSAQLIPDSAIAHQIEQSRAEATVLLAAKEQQILTLIQQQRQQQQEKQQMMQNMQSNNNNNNNNIDHIFPSDAVTQQKQQQATTTVAASASPLTLTLGGPRVPTPVLQRWGAVALSEPTVQFDRLATGFRFSKTVTLLNGGTNPVSYCVERTTGTTTMRADALSEARMVHPPVVPSPPASAKATATTFASSASTQKQQQSDETHKHQHQLRDVSEAPHVASASSARTQHASANKDTRLVQVQNQRGNVNPNSSVQITFIVDARAPRRIADCFLVRLDAPNGPALPVCVRAEIVKSAAGDDVVSLVEAGMHLSSSVKVLGATL